MDLINFTGHKWNTNTSNYLEVFYVMCIFLLLFSIYQIHKITIVRYSRSDSVCDIKCFQDFWSFVHCLFSLYFMTLVDFQWAVFSGKVQSPSAYNGNIFINIKPDLKNILHHANYSKVSPNPNKCRFQNCIYNTKKTNL